MNDDICATLSAIKNPLDTSILVMTQNLRYNNDGNGNDIVDRAPRFKAQVEKYQPDLIGVQESTAVWREILKEDYSDKYGIIGIPRDGENGSNESNNILYRLDRFELLESDTFWLSKTPDVPSKLDGSSLNRICTWALLKDKLTGKTVLMTNTHLDTPEISDEQSKIILDYFKDMIGKYPMFTTGDLNFKDYEAGYKVFIKSMSDSQDTALKNLSTVGYTYNNFGKSNSHRIDYIFHNALASPYEYKILTNEFGGYVSDHYGIYAKYVY
jgi:endonuclease/exonuclease/phosphatase family metal-dependent hydrolase